MKKKIILTAGASLLMLVGALALFWNAQSVSHNGIYASGNRVELESASSKASAFSKTVKALNEGWDDIELGNSYKRAGQYEEAIKAYKKAYEIDSGNRILTGRLIAETYEKLSRYDEAIAMIDEILKTQPLGEYGVEKYTAIRARLLAAKNQATNQ
jgi:tetratricopeptide (TPR) repeat protein